MARRRFGRTRRRARPSWILLIVFAIIAYQLWRSEQEQEQAPPAPPVAQGMLVRVKRVVDGDTLLLENGERVRLLGVDTPETKHPNKPVEPWGPEASEFTRLHTEGQIVRLQFDRERQDRHGRLLAYVYVDDWFLNEELIRAGLSRAETQYPYSEAMKRRFRQAEAEARAKGVGIWSMDRELRPVPVKAIDRRQSSIDWRTLPSAA